MTNKEMFKEIASEVKLFQNIDQKESFLFILGALVSRVISLKKAAEIMQMEPEVFWQILDLMGIEFSYLEPEDVSIERTW
jgi:predicted HTH domain antitoxin